jgi:hypothetical protein
MQEQATIDSFKVLSFISAIDKKMKSAEEEMKRKYDFDFDEDIPIKSNDRTFEWSAEEKLEIKMVSKAPLTPIPKKECFQRASVKETFSKSDNKFSIL